MIVELDGVVLRRGKHAVANGPALERDFRFDRSGQPLVAILRRTAVVLLAVASHCRTEYDSGPRD